MNKEIETIIHSIAFQDIEKHPNILIAARFWDDPRFHAAKVAYKFMRMIDDHIDDRKAMNQEISCLEKEELSRKVYSWIECLEGNWDHDPFYQELTETIQRFRIPLQLFHNFARSMMHDINHDGFSTMEQFIDYAEGASVAPASVFVHLCCLSEQNGEYSAAGFDVIRAARPCALFSYIVHIIRDFQEDQLHNLNYFAGEILARNNLTATDLRKIANGGTIPGSFRRVIGEYMDQAKEFEAQTLEVLEELSTKVHGRYMLSLHVIYHLYKMVFDRIDIEKGEFTKAELNPTPLEIKEKVLEIASGW